MPIKFEKKKDSNGYPLIAFRIGKEEKAQIMEKLDELVQLINELVQLINELVQLINEHKEDNEKNVRKNRVFIEAMHMGLNSMFDEYSYIPKQEESTKD